MPVRALVVTNMYPSPEHPALGSFVRDQVAALRRIDDLDVEVFAFAPGGAGAYPRAAAALRRRHGSSRFDIVHAHFGLTAWPALGARARARVLTLHGTDLAHPRSRKLTLAALPFIDLVAGVSQPLLDGLPRWAARRRTAVLPAGVDTTRFAPIPRLEARRRLGLDPDRPYLLFAANPARAEKRYDRAVEVARNVELLALRDVDPEDVPFWVNAANAVLVTSEREGFGLAVLEALACDVPVLATDIGIAPEALDGVAGTYCGPFDAVKWRAALAPHLEEADPRVQGRARAVEYSTDRMAGRVATAWRELLA
ncbi:MAG TPA: glycosyltransferase [Solirubrobacteraceae bacterium]|jgi:glycosyltransferase involved in cell wall biosynthesis|nr:glycosyltransferase [Solirubrobacteraceae bacterium]